MCTKVIKLGLPLKKIGKPDFLKMETKSNQKQQIIKSKSWATHLIKKANKISIQNKITSESDEQIQNYARLRTSTHTHIHTDICSVFHESPL